MSVQRVLLIGANNIVGSHVLEQLLARNVSVRAVVGTKEQAQRLEIRYPQTASSRLDIAIVSSKDYTFPGAFDDVLDGAPTLFDTIIHAGATEPSEEADCLSRFINLESETLINFVRSIIEVASNVRRVIFANSLSPFARWLVDPQSDRLSRTHETPPRRTQPIDTDYVLATSQASDNIVHGNVRDWMTHARAHLDLVTVTAPSIYGPSLHPLENSSDLEEANRRIWNICSNDSDERMNIPPYGINFFADVRDLAFAIVQAAFIPQAANKRFTVSAGTMPPGSAVADFLTSRFPELGARIRLQESPPPRPSSRDPPLEFVDPQLTASILGLTRYRSLDETLTDLARQMLELQRRKEWKSVIQS